MSVYVCADNILTSLTVISDGEQFCFCFCFGFFVFPSMVHFLIQNGNAEMDRKGHDRASSCSGSTSTAGESPDLTESTDELKKKKQNIFGLLQYIPG